MIMQHHYLRLIVRHSDSDVILQLLKHRVRIMSNTISISVMAGHCQSPGFAPKDSENISNDGLKHEPGSVEEGPQSFLGERRAVLDIEQSEDPEDVEDNHDYPTGLRLATMTLGIMAFVLMVALDNYILSEFYDKGNKVTAVNAY